MIRDVEVIELKIEDISPKYNEINVKIDSSIKVKFNSYINKSTVINNVYLLNEDTGDRVTCTLKAHDDMVELIPKENLLNSRKYKVCIPKFGVSDILGRKLLLDFSSSFYTDHNVYTSKPIVLEPKNQIYDTNPDIIFNCECDSCIIEISNSKSFNYIVYNKLINCSNQAEINHVLDCKLIDGLYYVRIKTDDNIFSDSIQFYISSGEGKVSNDDIDGIEVFDLNVVDELNVIEFMPSKIVTSNNLKNVYYKFDGKVDESVINKCRYSVKASSIDPTNKAIETHDNINCKMIYMYDNDENCTYLIFKLVEV